MTQIMNIVT